MNQIIKYLILTSLIFLNSKNRSAINHKIKQSHLNQNWYPKEKNALEKKLNFYLNLSKKEFGINTNSEQVKVIIAPHASLYYSGLCAASAYQALLKNAKKNTLIKNIIILAPSHVQFFTGIAIPDFKEYQTTLGKLKLNTQKINKLKQNQNFKVIKNIFDKEHAIEIQLPFLQKTVNDFKLIPLIIGHINQTNYQNITNTIKKIIDNNTLIIVSSDFVHYGKDYNYTPFNIDILDFIRFIDSAALEAIGKQSFNMFNTVLKNNKATICGQSCIKILLKLLEEKALGKVEPRLTCYYTSAQLTQARKKNKINIKKLLSNLPDRLIKNCVSYAGLVFTTQKKGNIKKEDQLTEYEKKSLKELAIRSIKNEFANQKLPNYLLWPIKSSGLEKKSGVFVTLNKKGNLRGCIGQIITNEPLFKTVQEMAKMAAFNDTRFNPLQNEEIKDLDISISILTPTKKIKNYKEIQLDKHGIILKKIIRKGAVLSSVFLPKVPTELGWNIQTTLEQLSLKAGLSKNEWEKNCNFEVFESFEIK